MEKASQGLSIFIVTCCIHTHTHLFSAHDHSTTKYGVTNLFQHDVCTYLRTSVKLSFKVIVYTNKTPFMGLLCDSNINCPIAFAPALWPNIKKRVTFLARFLQWLQFFVFPLFAIQNLTTLCTSIHVAVNFD